jgi:hypothetical protein
MLQNILIRRMKEGLAALQASGPLMEVLSTLESFHVRLDKHILGVAEGGGNKIQEGAGAVHTLLASLPGATKQLSARKLFREVEILEFRLSSALSENVEEPERVVDLLNELDSFADAYNNYVVHQTGANAFPLLLIARRLSNSISALHGFFEYTIQNLSKQHQPTDGQAELSVVLFDVSDLSGFVKKLSALQQLYEELSYVLNVSLASHPLRIGKIESGSLFTLLFGDTRVVGLMASLLESSVRFFHRNYTIEGKYAAIPKKIESLEALLNFSNRLKDAGVDVSTLQDSLAKNASSIIDSLNTIASDQATVEINGQVLAVGAELQRALLERKSTPKLQYSEAAAEVPKLESPSGS